MHTLSRCFSQQAISGLSFGGATPVLHTEARAAVSFNRPVEHVDGAFDDATQDFDCILLRGTFDLVRGGDFVAGFFVLLGNRFAANVTEPARADQFACASPAARMPIPAGSWEEYAMDSRDQGKLTASRVALFPEPKKMMIERTFCARSGRWLRRMSAIRRICPAIALRLGKSPGPYCGSSIFTHATPPRLACSMRRQGRSANRLCVRMTLGLLLRCVPKPAQSHLFVGAGRFRGPSRLRTPHPHVRWQQRIAGHLFLDRALHARDCCLRQGRSRRSRDSWPRFSAGRELSPRRWSEKFPAPVTVSARAADLAGVAPETPVRPGCPFSFESVRGPLHERYA